MVVQFQYPKHIAVIMDGNGRWAQKRGKPRLFGHRSGIRALKDFINYVAAYNEIKAITVFALSCENIARPKCEVDALLTLMETALDKELAEIHQQNIRIKFVGDIVNLSKKMVKVIEYAEQLTEANDRLTLTVALNYSGQWHIANEVSKMMAADAGHDQLDTQACLRELDSRLLLGDYPVDLLIRTSGEQRVSNFLLWQLGYAEFYFTECLWPDFNQQEFECAIKAYSLRKRRFGQLEEQLIES